MTSRVIAMHLRAFASGAARPLTPPMWKPSARGSTGPTPNFANNFHRHSRESGNPVLSPPTLELGPRFRGDDEVEGSSK